MTAHLKRTAALALTLLLAIHLATLARQAKRYTVTVFVDEGPQTAGEQLRAARGASRDANSSGTIVKTGHVFIGLSNGDINTYLGFYGNQEKGQVRVDADLVQNGYYNVSKTYEISEANYHAALAVATQWNTDGKRWALDHHCGDFAEAVARAAGVPLEDFPRDVSIADLGRNRPGLWGKYLRQHGGEVKGGFTGNWVFDQTGETVVISGGGGAYRMHLNGINWTLRQDGDVLVAQQRLTAGDVQALYGNLPRGAAAALVGQPTGVVLTLSTDGRAIQVQLVAPGVRYNGRGEFEGFIGAQTLTGILERR
jgi:hypothetical protein